MSVCLLRVRFASKVLGVEESTKTQLLVGHAL